MSINYPLTREHRQQLAEALRDVSRVDLSIDSVLEGHPGSVWVDHREKPTVYLLQAGPFCYFVGDPHSPSGQSMLRMLPANTFLMPAAPGWLEAALAIHKSRMVELERYSFDAQGLREERIETANSSRLSANKKMVRGERWLVRQMDRDFAEKLWGQEHFIDLSLFESPQDFIERGAGFYVEERNQIAGAAYSAMACSRGIEVSIYVQERWRRRGMATALASRLLLWALDHGIQPHWDAANPESARLAMKLGYRLVGPYTAYYLGE